MDIKSLLKVRGKEHGDFVEAAHKIKKFRELMEGGRSKLSVDQQHGLQMIFLKLARIYFNPNSPDNWNDIAGYAKLVAGKLEDVKPKKKKKSKPKKKKGKAKPKAKPKKKAKAKPKANKTKPPKTYVKDGQEHVVLQP